MIKKIINTLKDNIMVSKKEKTKKTKAKKIEVDIKKVEQKKEEITVESLVADGYIFLKEKGDLLIYSKDGVRKSIPK